MSKNLGIFVMYACTYSTLQYSMYVFTNKIITKILRDIRARSKVGIANRGSVHECILRQLRDNVYGWRMILLIYLICS